MFGGIIYSRKRTAFLAGYYLESSCFSWYYLRLLMMFFMMICKLNVLDQRPLKQQSEEEWQRSFPPVQIGSRVGWIFRHCHHRSSSSWKAKELGLEGHTSLKFFFRAKEALLRKKAHCNPCRTSCVL